MRPALRAWCAVLALAALAALHLPVQAQQGGKRIALLVGIGNYQNPHVAPNLEGVPNDLAAMRSVLVRKLGVREADIETLADAQATRPAILQALRRLEARSAPGDHVIIYFSGHGTSRLNMTIKVNSAALPYSSGAFITHEFSDKEPEAGMIVGRTDMLPIITKLEEGKRSLFVVYDSCFSGNAVRSVSIGGSADDRLGARFIPPSFAARETALFTQEGPRQAPEPYPYRNTVFIGASSEGEVARDIRSSNLRKYPTLDGKPHGAFTDALLRVLEGDLFADYDHNGRVDYSELSAAIAGFVAQRGYGHTPQRLPTYFEDSNQLTARAVFAVGPATQAPPPRPAGPLLVSANGVNPEVVGALRALSGVQVVPADHASPDIRLAPHKVNASTVEIRTGSGDLISDFTAATPAEEWLGRITQFAWHKRMRTLAEQGRRGLLKAEVSPNQFGGNFLEDEQVRFIVRPDRPAHLLLVNVDALGKVTVLYPYSDAEIKSVPAGQFAMPPLQEAGIRTEKPYGMDMQLLFAFDQSYPELRSLLRLEKRGAGDPALGVLEQLLTKAAGRYTMAVTELRVLPRPAQ